LVRLKGKRGERVGADRRPVKVCRTQSNLSEADVTEIQKTSQSVNAKLLDKKISATPGGKERNNKKWQVKNRPVGMTTSKGNLRSCTTTRAGAKLPKSSVIIYRSMDGGKKAPKSG